MQVTFTAATLANLAQQLRDFLGVEPVAPAAPVAPATRPVPTWAPAGSVWVPMPGAPALRGPDGLPVPIRWVDGLPLPGTAVHFSDPASEAAGAALEATMRRD